MTWSLPKKPVVVFVAVAATIGLFLLLAENLQTSHWQGRANLNLSFIVVDGETDRRIEGAVVEFRNSKETAMEFSKADLVFKSVTDEQGTATADHEVPHGGTFNAFGIGDTQAAHLPWWHGRITVASYDTLDIPYFGGEYRNRVEQVGPAAYRLLMPIKLKKSASP